MPAKQERLDAAERHKRRNQVHLDAPSPDTKENREAMEKHHKQFGRTVIWNTAEKVTEKVAGQEITTKVEKEPEVKETPPEPKKETKSDDKNAKKVVEDKKETKEQEIPEDLKCPHCGSTARSEASYKKNHGDNCWQKPS